MIDLRLAEIALGRVGGANFERYFHALLAAIYGTNFIPVGGNNDGGVDAFMEAIYESGSPTRFFQASIQSDHRSKIRQTITRIREVGRDPKELTYCTSKQIDRVDQEDDLLSVELGATIRIRDQRWIINNVNYSAQTEAAFESYLSPELSFLKHVGGSSLLDNVRQDDTRALFVFLEQELARRRNQSDVLIATMDSLILWALEGTDPDKNIFLNRDEILSKVEGILPSSKHFMRGSIDHRLEQLCAKNNAVGREVRYHRQQNGYCLPYETRLKVEAENADDELLKKHFLEGLETKAMPYLLADELRPDHARLISSTAHTAIEKAFENQGIELSAFISGNSPKDQQLSISDYVDSALADAGLASELREKIKEGALAVLRTALYESTPLEREYFNKLSRTYTLLFTLRTDARVIEYFRSMSTKLILYVGADLLVRALSEHYLRPEDRMTTNLLLILRKSGAKLILNEKSAEEVCANMRVSDHEYNNWFKWSEPNVTTAVVRHCSKILVRSYFYAKISPPHGISAPSGWAKYIDQFLTYDTLHSSRGLEELKDYLCRKFDLTYESEEEMLQGVNIDHLEALKELILEIRPNKDKGDLLAYNDALQVLRIYAKRKQINDRYSGSIFGYQTWWLTHETHIMSVTGPLIRHYDARYIMRPEFVLNFIALAPTMEEVRLAYGAVFPSLLSIKLSNRMRDDVFHDVMGKYKRACEYDPARIEVKTRELTNRLKGDNYKEYEVDLRGKSDN
jgi:hypothetical protein